MDTDAKPGRQLLAGALAATALIAVAPAAEADTFIKFEGIKGESLDSKHKDEVDVLAWSWGVASAVTDPKGKTQQAACAEQLTLNKYTDRSTPPLFTAAALGTPIPSARLSVRRSTQSGTGEYFAVDLGGVTVKSVNQAGSGGDARVVESVTLAFTTAKISYSPQNPDGSMGTAITAFVPAACP